MRYAIGRATLVVTSKEQAVKLNHLLKEYGRAYRGFMAKAMKEGRSIDWVNFRRKYLPAAVAVIDLGKGHLRCAAKHAFNDYHEGREHGVPSYARVPPSRYYIAPCGDGQWVVVLQWSRGNNHVTVLLDGDSDKYPWLNDMYDKGCERGNLYVSQELGGEWTIGVDLFYD